MRRVDLRLSALVTVGFWWCEKQIPFGNDNKMREAARAEADKGLALECRVFEFGVKAGLSLGDLWDSFPCLKGETWGTPAES